MQLDLDLNFRLLTVHGTSIKEVESINENGSPVYIEAYAYSTIANLLANKTKHFKARNANCFAEDLAKNKSIKINDADMAILEKEIEESELSNRVKALILIEIDNAKDEAKKKESKPSSAPGHECTEEHK